MEVLEKFVIETKKLPENFEFRSQNEQKNYIIENGIFQQQKKILKMGLKSPFFVFFNSIFYILRSEKKPYRKNRT